MQTKVYYPQDVSALASLLKSIAQGHPVIFLDATVNLAASREVNTLCAELTLLGIPSTLKIYAKQVTPLTRTEFYVLSYTNEHASLSLARHAYQHLHESKSSQGLGLLIPPPMVMPDQPFITRVGLEQWGDLKNAEWEPYDSIDHFLPLAYPEFAARQQDAADHIYTVLQQFELDEIHDVGCGSGEILLRLERLYRENGGRIPALFGYDPSASQVKKATRLLAGKAFIKQARLNDVRMQAADKSAVLMVGHTMAHIGPSAVRHWLEQSVNPAVMLVDHGQGWKKNILRRDFPEATGANKPVVYVHLTTLSGQGRWVNRSIALTFVGNDQDTPSIEARPICSQQLLIPIAPEEPQAYRDIFHQRGYHAHARASYISGWGEHKLDCFKKGLKPAYSWPEIAAQNDAIVCEKWYQLLQQCWNKMNAEVTSPYILYPAAVVPFCPTLMYARYIQSKKKQARVEDVFKVWMAIVDPGCAADESSSPEDHNKLPYAPAVFRTLLSDSSAWVLEVVEPTARDHQFELGPSDITLAGLEREWTEGLYTPADENPFLALSVYANGIPCFLLIHRLADSITPSFEYAFCRVEARRLTLELERLLTEDVWCDFIGNLKNCGVDYDYVAAFLDNIAARAWTDWLDISSGRTSRIGDSAVAAKLSAQQKIHMKALAIHYSTHIKDRV